MCGIVGFLGGRWNSDSIPAKTVRAMANSIATRGPDGGGFWFDPERRIAFGHRRLAIQDLSAAGHQPMLSHSGRYVIVFNGEIYNHLELRALLERAGQPVIWRGRSDTETLVAAFDAWGVQPTIERCNGMFAFGVWDRQTDALSLARDRLGEKPLYYGWQGCGEDATFMFGSELKALRAHPAFEGKIDRGALTLQLRHSCVPAPHSIYEGIFKLEPGRILCLSPRTREQQIRSYWSATAVAEAGLVQNFTGTSEQAADELEALLGDSVHQRMLSDVPLGAFLSGGVDSSTIVALMQAQSTRPVRTFTIGFHERGFDEAKLAKAVAQHLGTDHTELYLTANQALSVIHRLPSFYDEPFADPSQIPTILVSELARQHVTVSLSGDGGDELFCGYDRYRVGEKLWSKLTLVPPAVRQIAAKCFLGISPRAWNGMANVAKPLLPSWMGDANLGDKILRGAALLGSRSNDEMYLRLMSLWDEPAAAVIGGYEPATLMSGNVPPLVGLNEMQRMMAMDTVAYLPDDILTKIDRAAMGVSLETRAPFLDHRVVEFAWRLPQSMKLRAGQSKWLLRQVMYRHVPRELVDRPKMGFSVPIADWLRGDLRDWADALLDPARLRREGYFEPLIIARRWKEHVSGERNWQSQLWNVLMFQVWLEQRQAEPTESVSSDVQELRAVS